MTARNKPRRDVYADVTASIVAKLDQAIADRAAGKKWHMPWSADRRSVSAMAPQSVRGHAYRGINWAVTMSSSHNTGLWATYRAWQTVGGQVRKGERGTTVIHWHWFEVDEIDPRTGKPKRLCSARPYTVFASSQVEGFDLAAWRRDHPPAEPSAADRVITDYVEREQITLRHGGNAAWYIPSTDAIDVPHRHQFHDPDAYYATLLHECGHSTGHPRRLDRNMCCRFGDSAYAIEELVAELAAAMACAAVGISATPRDDHAQYLASWLKVLRDDKRAIFTAASKAQQAADYIVSAAAAAHDNAGDVAPAESRIAA